uniref:Uncharacterized protein n=1 Tax=Caenorhabditis japonica TaxID=281687 RepID=A0A8R1I8F4_CAEJA
MNQPNNFHPSFFFFFFFTFCSLASTLKCYAGSRGYIKQQLVESFIEETCDHGMEWCIESFSPEYDEVTMNCQRLATSRRVLSICESGKPETSNNVTTRCCSESLCNSKGRLARKLSINTNQ